MLIIGVMGLGFIGFVLFSAYEVKSTLYKERQMKTRHLVEMATGIVDRSYQRYRTGEWSEAEAKDEAMRLLNALRYDDKEYFWVNDTRPVILMHPLNPQLNGADLKSTNPKMFELFSAFSRTATSNEKGGFYSYEWAKPGQDPSVLYPKISYLQYFKPWGWVIGSGIYVDDVTETFHEVLTSELIKASIILLIVFAVAMCITSDLTRPMHRVCDNLNALAKGQTDLEVHYTERKDEVGDIARAFEVFRNNLIEKNTLEETNKAAAETQARERREAMLKLADRFDAQVGTIVAAVSSAADMTQSMASLLTDNIRSSTEQSGLVARAANTASASVSSVAAATEELTASIREIASNITRTATTTRNCAGEAQASQQKLAALRHAVEEIDSVIQAINDVATQTNLLALNATIEAARAGEAGKGFSVVASEVKQLATKTHQMTDEISRKVENIKASASDAINTVDTIIREITSVDQVTNQIAAAVEEQNVATQEISRNVQDASSGTNEVSNSISGVLESGERSSASTEELKRASENLAEQARELQGAVGHFLAEVRA